MGRVTREEIARAMAVHSMSDDIRTDADADETEGVVVTDGEGSSTGDANTDNGQTERVT